VTHRFGKNASVFDDLLEANARYRSSFRLQGLEGSARRGLAVLTCIDSRIEPLAMLGLEPGDAKILRNAGGRVTDDVLRTLGLAANFLGVVRICIVHHTDCAMTRFTNEEFTERLAERGVDAEGWDFLAIGKNATVMRDDLARISTCPLIPDDVELGAFVYDVHTGALNVLPLP
jgi:carbonic anhydrase